MIQVRIIRLQNGILRSCQASGHAGYASEGEDIVCAAVSSILRTVLSLLDSNKNVKLEVNTPERGKLAFSVREYSKTDSVLLTHCGDFLVAGLSLLQKEYPNNVELREQTEK